MMSSYASLFFAILLITQVLYTTPFALAAPSNVDSAIPLSARHLVHGIHNLVERDAYVVPSPDLKSLSRHQLKNLRRKKSLVHLHKRSLSLVEVDELRKRFWEFGDDYARHTLSSSSKVIDKFTGKDTKVDKHSNSGKNRDDAKKYNRVDGQPLRTVGKFF